MDTGSVPFSDEISSTYTFAFLRWQSLVLLAIATGIFAFVYAKSQLSQNGSINEKTLKKPPLVKGNNFLVGHGRVFIADPLAFMLQCYKEYGSVFQVNLGRIKTVIICDRTLSHNVFKSTEDTGSLSFNAMLSKLCITESCTNQPSDFPRMFEFIKKSVFLRYETYVPRIVSQAKIMIHRFKTSQLKSHLSEVDLSREMSRFVAATSTKCFVGVDMTDEIFDALNAYLQCIRQLLFSSYIFPKNLIIRVAKRRIDRLRLRLRSFFLTEIQSYFDNEEKCASVLMREAVDYRDEEGQGFSLEEISDMVVTLLYGSSENTVLGLMGMLIDLALRPTYWKSLKEELDQCLEKNDYKGIMSSELLNSCIMESARHNCHILSVCRVPQGTKMIGNYYVGDADCVAICGPLLMLHGNAEELFKNPLEYHPERFMGLKAESFRSNTVVTWSAGVHGCPGKVFSIYEIKMAMALIINNFEMDVTSEGCSVSPNQYYTSGAFAERRVKVKLTPI